MDSPTIRSISRDREIGHPPLLYIDIGRWEIYMIFALPWTISSIEGGGAPLYISTCWMNCMRSPYIYMAAAVLPLSPDRTIGQIYRWPLPQPSSQLEYSKHDQQIYREGPYIDLWGIIPLPRMLLRNELKGVHWVHCITRARAYIDISPTTARSIAPNAGTNGSTDGRHPNDVTRGQHPLSIYLGSPNQSPYR